MRIPTLAIHLDRNSDGFTPNTQTHLALILATSVKEELNKAVNEMDLVENDESRTKNQKHHSLLLKLLANEADCEPGDICDFELQLCDTQPSIIAGALKEFVLSGRLDNLCSSFCSLKEKHEENHQPKMHGGLVIKHNANQRYATNAITSFIFREIVEKAPASRAGLCGAE